MVAVGRESSWVGMAHALDNPEDVLYNITAFFLTQRHSCPQDLCGIAIEPHLLQWS